MSQMRAAVLIHADIAPVQAEQPAASGLPMRHGPERFNRHSHYLICDQAHLVAVWQNNGRGWMLKTDFGMRRCCPQSRPDSLTGRFQAR